jgi:ATP-dependent DNA helicase RecG
MRPAVLNPLFAPVSTLPGIGPALSERLVHLLSPVRPPVSVLDLLFHLPHATIDRRSRPSIQNARPDEVATVKVRVCAHHPPARRFSKAPYRVVVEDESDALQLVFFHAHAVQVARSLPVGATKWISGRIERKAGVAQMVHPDRIMSEAQFEAMAPVEPVYGLSEGLTSRLLARAAAAGLTKIPALPEWHSAQVLDERRLPGFVEALTRMHRPRHPSDLDPGSVWASRLAFDELLANQLALALVRSRMRARGGRASVGDQRLSQKIEAALPFDLTASQRTALVEIRNDLAQPARMHRLLHGDVGSGKTVVALLAMTAVVEAGRQAALMAPTELLARQHYQRLRPLAERAGIRLALFTGRDSLSGRTAKRTQLADGTIDIAIGTHALFHARMAFHDLALAIVDEQHRFGVAQRLALSNKGPAVDILVMSATPIPRTLVLAGFGDMEVSTLADKPKGRQSIDTRAVALRRFDEVCEAVFRKIGDGAQAYWICPLVSDNEGADLAAAKARFDDLRQRFGGRVGLVHGQMAAAGRDAEMQRFERRHTDILVATTVVEVGMDVPNATVIVVEHAERFGLAQLHQLRGRVGRGGAKSSCLLLYKEPLSTVAAARLKIIRESEDGFRIAEEDLKLRGAGELLGTRQSGIAHWRFASSGFHTDWLPRARHEAHHIMAADPLLQTPRGEALRLLLYLFDRDEAVRSLGAD